MAKDIAQPNVCLSLLDPHHRERGEAKRREGAEERKREGRRKEERELEGQGEKTRDSYSLPLLPFFHSAETKIIEINF